MYPVIQRIEVGLARIGLSPQSLQDMRGGVHDEGGKTQRRCGRGRHSPNLAMKHGMVQSFRSRCVAFPTILTVAFTMSKTIVRPQGVG
jgi:hypothetical protein